ncbi:MAG: cysteine desulfurase family protein [Caldilinea sp.]
MKPADIIYLDYNATTPCDPRVLAKMRPYFDELFANPANGYHRWGRLAARAVEDAREQIGALINAAPKEIVFTAGATESNNLAILGLARRARNRERRRIVTTAVEHKAVLLPCKRLVEEGFDLIILPVDEHGCVRLDAAQAAINDETLLVSVQAANNEIGTIQPVAEIAEIAHAHGALVHCDAAQALGKIPVDVDRLGVDLLSASAHKLYGPKGIGCLYVRGGTRSIALEPLLYGGGQEHGLRSGTTNVPGAVGFGEACAIAQTELSQEMARLQSLRDAIELALQAKIPTLHINGRGTARLPNTSSLTFPGIDADALLLNLPDLMLGTGSACTSGAVEPSHVLTAIGLNRDLASATVRLSLGRFVAPTDVQRIVSEIVTTITQLP